VRLVIDMQGAQSSGSRNRGIGRYTLALAREIVRQRGDHEVILALNGAFADTIEPLKAEFADLLPAEAVRVWFPPTPCRSLEPANDPRRKAAEAIYEAFLASHRPDAILVTSLFEGLIDDVVTSIGQFDTAIPRAVILYDLIPLIHRHIYLANPDVERWYQRKLDHLRRADLLLSISASSGREAVDHLGVAASQVVTISTACNDEFKPAKVSPAQRSDLARRYGLTKAYVMYTGGIDHRKNIEGLIRAFGLLPKSVRSGHQLAVVCAAHDTDRSRLLDLARSAGLSEGELVMTGFVPEDDLLALYRGCALFVFPSWHEGFGLPALEAMACGRPTIGANTSSLPEVIGWEEAMFDPYDDQAIAELMAKSLTDQAFRKSLEQNARKQAQAFSWTRSARTAWQAIERLPFSRKPDAIAARPAHRPKLAFLSPLPAARSGIADYSAELLPELSRHYDIDVILMQDEPLADSWVSANAPIRSVEWFKRNHRAFDRVMYHFGNSHFHSHMFDLLPDIPGVVVLHDFFLSGIIAHLEFTGAKPGLWAKTLLADHGWLAVQQRYQAADSADVIWAYPCNGDVFRSALGGIFHSRHGMELGRTWLGARATENWCHVPLLRRAQQEAGETGHTKRRLQARSALGIGVDDFVVCAFGHMGRTKLNDRLLDAWLASNLARNAGCRLVFVGQNEGGQFGGAIARRVKAAGDQIQITGFVDHADYRHWLHAADVAVQLRAKSRGETSAAVLDCWNAGLATIVNAHGAFAELPDDSVVKLADEFSDAELVGALHKLHSQAAYRQTVGRMGRARLLDHHDPRSCADAYAAAVEACYAQARCGLQGLIGRLPSLVPDIAPPDGLSSATAISASFPPVPRRRQWLVDVSELARVDSKSGIQRVVRAVLSQMLKNPPSGVSVRPVYASMADDGYRYADRFTAKFLQIDDGWCEDHPIEAWQGDVFFALDLQPAILSRQIGQLQQLRLSGVKAMAVVYDLLPIALPETFVPGASDGHSKWLEIVQSLDGALCISQAVADELIDWLNLHGDRQRNAKFEIHQFPLGADIGQSAPTRGSPAYADALAQIIDDAAVLADRNTDAAAECAQRFTWQASADAVKEILLGHQQPYALWPPEDHRVSGATRATNTGDKP
jgi:glycosyltransferase involved in cell wall biosynthesis